MNIGDILVLKLYIYIEGEFMRILRNYKSMIILVFFIVIGAIIGLLWGSGASVLKPLGDLFLNMLLVVIVPLIFLSIATSIYKMKQPRRMGKILVTTFIVFLVTSIVAVFIGVASTYSFELVNSQDGESIKEELSVDESDDGNSISLNGLEKFVEMTTVNDFVKLLSKDNMIALIVISILVGFSMHMAGDMAEPVYKFMESCSEIVNNLIKIIMYYAPIGLGCYFASLVGTFGGEIAVGYLRTFIIYLVTSIFFYFVIYTIFAYISAGKNGVRMFWRNILPSTVTALGTCSSAASMPVNMECSKKMGISEDIVDTTVSLGTSFHKDGSVIGSVFKIMFLVYLFNDVGNISILKIMGIAIISTLLVILKVLWH